jgi:hypothetical protein
MLQTGSYAQAIMNAFLSSRLGEAELLVAALVGLFFIVFLLRGRDPEYRRDDFHHRHS